MIGKKKERRRQSVDGVKEAISIFIVRHSWVQHPASATIFMHFISLLISAIGYLTPSLRSATISCCNIVQRSNCWGSKSNNNNKIITKQGLNNLFVEKIALNYNNTTVINRNKTFSITMK